MQIFVRTVNGKTIAIDVSAEDSSQPLLDTAAAGITKLGRESNSAGAPSDRNSRASCRRAHAFFKLLRHVVSRIGQPSA